MKIYEPLYGPDGAPCRGFVCNYRTGEELCGTLCKNERNMKDHLLTQHGIKIQQELEFGDGEPAENVRGQRASEEPGSGETYPPPSDSIYKRAEES